MTTPALDARHQQLADASTPPRLDRTQPFGDAGWRIWTSGILRSAGFPVECLRDLSDPTLGEVADAANSGRVDRAAADAAYDRVSAHTTSALAALTSDPAFTTALTWQNRPMLGVLAKLAEDRPENTRRRSDVRAIARYRQRYSSKAECIGFFGPFAWLQVGGQGAPLQVDHGPGLVVARHVAFEAWMVIELGRHLAADPDVAWWLPPVLRPDVFLDGDRLVRPDGSHQRIAPADRAVLALADGRHRAADIEAELMRTHPELGLTRDRIVRVLRGQQRRRLLAWDANVPLHARAWDVLVQRVDAIEDDRVRDGVRELVDRFECLRREVGEAQDAEQLCAALDAVDALFTETTDREATRGAGKAYAARTLVYHDAVRDTRLRVSDGFLDALAPALELVLQSADWFAGEVSARYEAAISALVRDRQQSNPGRPVTLADVWPASLELFWGEDPHPLREAERELARRWARVIGPVDTEASRVERSVTELTGGVAEQFAAGVPQPALAVHSPDLQVVASDVDAVARGEFSVVISELHACLASFDVPAVDWSLDRPVRDQVNAHLGLHRPVPLLPEGWRRQTGRVLAANAGESDLTLGVAAAPGVDLTVNLPAVSIVFDEIDGRLVARTPQGQLLTIPEVWAVFISDVAADAFKIGLPGAHTPRFSVGPLTLFRETWRLRLDDVSRSKDRHQVFRDLRAWRAAHHLPERVYVKFPREAKPFYLDFSSPTLVASFATLAQSNDQVSISECLPDPQTSWLTDSEGRHYVSELRLQLTRAQVTA